ncbi:MAG TPA: PRC-barrel domain-containing protein [Stellaceae bacterium]|nr:PRC-barrel domain-containing protein [Stellaceae bacterium]
MKRRRARFWQAALAGALALFPIAAAGDEGQAPNSAAAAVQASVSPPAAEQAKPAPQAPPEPSPPQNLETLPPAAAVAILGKKVRDASGKDLGLVVDVLVNREAQPVAAVIDVGGFLGVGSRKIAVDWVLLRFRPDDVNAPVALALDRGMVQGAPEYKPSASQPAKIVGPPPAQDSSPASEK